MPHRARFQYVVRDNRDRLLMSIFTAPKICQLSPFRQDGTMVIDKIAIRAPRSVMADTLREARKHKYQIARIVSTYDSSEFCNVYCKQP